MRIISYNILDGGVGRADPLVEVIKAQRPDVVVLVEADDAEMRSRIAWRLGMDMIVGEGRKGHTAALLTRGRIIDSVNLAAMHDHGPRSLLLATVELEGASLKVVAVHLTSKASEEQETKREAEIATVLEALRPLRQAGTPHVICGDFNANSPVQQLSREALPDKSKSHWDANGGGIPRRVIQSVLDAGYVDTLAVHRPDDVGQLCSFTTQQPGQRVDYLFAFGVNVSDAWIERDRLAEYASDHFPIGAEVELDIPPENPKRV